MAGEIDDHIHLQAEYLPTGSISFGRFEMETLSWERRSSFSHNRYLEEVEKFSTQGSVTRKKAYFEAHFKKRGGLLHQISSISHSGSEGQTAQHETEDHLNYMDDYDGQRDEGEPLEEFQNHADDGIQFCWYDESPVHSDDNKYEVVDGEGDEVTLVPQLPTDPIVHDNMTSMDTNTQYMSFATIDQAQECDVPLVKNNNTQIDVELDTDNDVADVVGSFQNKDALSLDPQVEAIDSSHSKSTKKISKMVDDTLDEKTTKLKPKARSSAAQIPQRSSTEKRSPSSVDSLRKIRKNSGIETPLKMKIEKLSEARASSATIPASRNMKPENSQNANAKGASDTYSLKNGQKDSKLKRGVSLPESAKGIRSTSVTRSANRPNLVIDSMRSHLKTAGTVFNFKSDERAEKRKEFYVKLEEKQHAREAHMNEMQVKTQEEKEVKMKQFRRSLNFKATPMPSFYHEGAPKGSTGKKAIVKSPTPQASRRSPSSKTIPRASSPSISNAADRESTAGSDLPSNICHPDSSTIQENNSINRSLLIDEATKTAAPGDVTKSNRIEMGKKDERSKAKPAPSRGDGKAKNNERVGRVRSSSAAKAMRSNNSRASPAIRVSS